MFAAQNLESVFTRLIEPPAMESLEAAKQRLQDLGALTSEEMLTPLGYHLACLPVDVRIGKLILFGAIFRCLDPALTIAASLAFKSPFVSKLNIMIIIEPERFYAIEIASIFCPISSRCLHGISETKPMRRNWPSR